MSVKMLDMAAKPQIAETLIDLPGQVRILTAQSLDWVRTDSLPLVIGAGVAVFTYLLLVGVRILACRWLGNDDDIASWRGFARRMVGKTRSFFLAALSAEIVAQGTAQTGTLLAILTFVFTVAAAFQGAIWVRELILGLVARRAAATDEDHHTLASAMGIIKVLVNVLVWSIAAILVLDNLGVNVTGLVAGLGVGGIAIGLAAQGIFGDLFAALAILFDRPFRVGDTIKFGDVTGSVEAIGLKTVRIRATTGEQVIVSNAKLLELQIRNLRRIEARTTTMTFLLDLGSTAKQLREVPAMLANAFEGLADVEFHRAHVVGVSAIAVEIEIEFVVHQQSLVATLDAKQAVILAALDGFAKLGLRSSDTTPRSPERSDAADSLDATDAVPALEVEQRRNGRASDAK